MKKLVLILAVALVFGFSANASALITPNETTVDLNVYNAIETLLSTTYGSNAAVDFLQASPDEYWHNFSTEDMPGGYIAIGVSAGNLNSLSVFRPPTPGTLIPTDLTLIGNADLFFDDGINMFGTGTIGDPYKLVAESVLPGENFGWALESFTGPLDSLSLENTWYSDPGLNSDKLDHMLSYHLGDLAGDTVYILLPIDGDTCEEGEVEITNADGTFCRLSYTFDDPFLIAWEDLPNLGDGDYNDMLYLVDRVRPIPEPISMLLFGSGLFGLIGLRRKQS